MAFKMKGFSGFKREVNTPEEEQSKITDSKKIYVDGDYNEGDDVDEDDFESQFSLKGNDPKNYPQLSVQDYSTVKNDNVGSYVTKLNE